MVHTSFPDDAVDKELVRVDSNVYQYDLKTETWDRIVGENGKHLIVGDTVYIWENGLLIDHDPKDPKQALSTLLTSIKGMVDDWHRTEHSMTVNEVHMLNTAARLKSRFDL